MNDAILEQLKIAMEYQPSLSVIQVINEAVARHFATRKTYNGVGTIKVNWEPSNSDILVALTKFNETRKL
jgi:hypothetical protein